MIEKPSDVVCIDTGKTRVELDLDNMYSQIMYELDYLLTMSGLEKGYLEQKLNNGEMLQSELDSALMELIEIIKYGGNE